jgi:hypothetical protein
MRLDQCFPLRAFTRAYPVAGTAIGPRRSLPWPGSWILCCVLTLAAIPQARADGRWDQGLFVGNGAPGLFSACLAPGAPSSYGFREVVDLAWNGQDWIESKDHVTTGTWHVRTGVRGAAPSVWRTATSRSVATPIELRKLYLAKQPVLDCGHWLPGPRDDFLREASATPPLIATSVAAGVQLSCAILDDGTPRCWGDVGSGSVGADTGGAVASILVPNARQIALTGRACALRTDGSVACWGGRAGGGDAAHPATVDAPAKATTIPLGSQLCAILADDSVACSNKQPVPPARLVPVPGIKDAISISAGSNGRSCAVTRLGEVNCWGRLAPPPVLNEDEDSIQLAVTHIAGIDHAIAVATGRVQDCALLDTGKVSCWSYDRKAQPQPAPALPLEQVSALSSSSSHACAMTAAGEVYCWNDPYTSIHGNATAITQVKDLKDATMISVSADHACALVRGGSVRCWGRNTAAQLGSLHDLMQPGQPADGGMTSHVVFGFADDSAH